MHLIPVDVIQANSPSGAVRPLRFRVEGRSVDIDRILFSESTRSVSGDLLVYHCETREGDLVQRYRLTLDPKTRIWYLSVL